MQDQQQRLLSKACINCSAAQQELLKQALILPLQCWGVTDNLCKGEATAPGIDMGPCCGCVQLQILYNHVMPVLDGLAIHNLALTDEGG